MHFERSKRTIKYRKVTSLFCFCGGWLFVRGSRAAAKVGVSKHHETDKRLICDRLVIALDLFFKIFAAKCSIFTWVVLNTLNLIPFLLALTFVVVLV